jgi:hypothetical protein
MARSLASTGVCAIGFVLAGLGSAEAARCPQGQIYRVSLGVCASKAANLKFYRGETIVKAANAAKREPKTSLAALDATGAIDDRAPEASEPTKPAPAASPIASPDLELRRETPTPFGALPSPDSFKLEP